jgi:hypothetical protein
MRLSARLNQYAAVATGLSVGFLAIAEGIAIAAKFEARISPRASEAQGSARSRRQLQRCDPEACREADLGSS